MEGILNKGARAEPCGIQNGARAQRDLYPSQQNVREMAGAHLANPLSGELDYALWPQLGTKFWAR